MIYHLPDSVDFPARGVRHFTRLTYRALQELATIPKLGYVNVTGCGSITNRAVKNFQAHSSAQLFSDFDTVAPTGNEPVDPKSETKGVKTFDSSVEEPKTDFQEFLHGTERQ